MKNILTALLIVASTSLFAQDYYPSPFEFRFIDSTTATKLELYTRARSWVATTFGSAQAVLQMDDKDVGRIIGKANMLWPYTGLIGNVICKCPIAYTFTIDVKEGKFRCVLTDFTHSGCFDGKTQTPSGGNLAFETPLEGGWTGLTKKQWRSI